MSQSTTVQCPHCGQQYTMTPQQVGQTVQCIRCKQPFTAGISTQAPAVPPQSAAYSVPGPYDTGSAGEYASPRPTSGMAIASLICGILFCMPFCSLLAIIFGIIGINQTKDPRVGGKGMSITGLVLGILAMVMILPMMIAIMLPALNRARETANRVSCASHMRMIAVALNQYANSNNNAYPPDLNVLVQKNLITAKVLECPSSNVAPGGSSPFVLSATGPMDSHAVILYEPVADHKSGANMVFGDGHVEFMPMPQAQKIINDVQNGTNPPSTN